MERQQYIEDLVNQNLTDEEIFAKLDEFDNQTDPPKKTTDPLKQETSTGSSDTVSKLDDGSLGLQALSSQEELEQEVKLKKPTQLITELEVPEGVDPEEYRKRMQEAYAGISDFDRLDPVEIKTKPTISTEALISPAGVRVWLTGDYIQRKMAAGFIQENAGDDVAVPEVRLLEDRLKQKEEYETIQTKEGRVPYYDGLTNFMTPKRGVETFEETFDPESDILGFASGDATMSKFFRETGGFIDRAFFGYKPPQVFNYMDDVKKGQDIMFVSFSGKEPDFLKETKQRDDLAIYDPITDTYKGGKYRTTKLPQKQSTRIEKLLELEHLAQSSKYKTENSYIDHVYNEGDKFLSREELEYKALKERYNSTENPDEKKDIKMKLDALDLGEDLFDDKGKLISYDKKPTKKTSKEEILVQERLAEIIKKETDEDVLKKNLAVSYSRLITLGKEVKNAGIELEKDGLVPKSIKNIKADPYVYLSDFLGNVDDALKIAETGDIPKDIKLLGGDHPLADAFNDALVEFKALNRAIKLNIDPIKDEIEIGKNFINGLLKTAEGYLGDIKMPELTTARDQALAIDNVLKSSGYDTDSKSYIIEKDNIYNNITKETPAFLAGMTELVLFRKTGGGAGTKIEGIKKLGKINPLVNFGSKVVNKGLDIGVKAVAEGITFAEIGLLKGDFDSAASNFKFGAGLGLVSGITNPLGGYVTRNLFNNPIGRSIYKYNSSRFLTTNAISSTIGGSQFVIADALVNSDEYKNPDGTVNFEKIKEKTITEAFKFSIYNFLPSVGKPGWAKDFSYALESDVKEMFNNPSRELNKAASDFNISLNDINKNKQGIQQEIEEKRVELIEGKTEEETEKINQQALALTNQSNMALYNQYVNPRKEFTDREIFETGIKMISGEQLSARQIEVASKVPSAVIYKSIRSTDNRSASETMQFLENRKQKYEIIENELNSNENFKTSWRTEKQRTKVANRLEDYIDLQSEYLRLQGKEKSVRTPEENSRILDLEIQIDQSLKDAKYISDRAFEKGYKKDIEQSKKINKTNIIELSDKDYKAKMKEVTGKDSFDDGLSLGFFDSDTNTRYINKDAARETKTITTGIHETGHLILSNSLKEPNTNKVSEKGIKIIDEVLNELNKSQREIVQERIDSDYRFDDNGKEKPKEDYYEEYLTVLSEEIADKNIVFNNSIGDALLDFIPFMRKSGLPNLEISTSTGKQLFDLISSYSSGKSAGIKKARELADESLQTEKESGVELSKRTEEKPKAVFLVGSPGAGKTATVGAGLKLGRRGFKVVNQDIVLEPLKKDYGLSAEESGYTAEQRSLRSKLGAEAKKAANDKFNKYMSNKNDMVIDGTSASYNATTKKIKALKEAGFDVYMVAAVISKPAAIKRNQERTERSLPDFVVEKTYDQVQESLAKYKDDFGDKLYEVNTEDIKQGEDLPQEFLNKFYKGIGVEGRNVAYSKKRKSELFKSIDDLVKEKDRNIKSKEEFMMSESFNDIFSSIALEGGAINNYIRSKSSSVEEAMGIVESMQDRLLNFDPSKTRATGEEVGMQGLTENLIANVNFAKKDTRLKLAKEAEERDRKVSIDKEEVREIADETELTLDVAEEAQVRRSPGIDPLKFEGVKDLSSIEIKDIKGKTLKEIGKEYAGQVGQAVFDVPAKKITVSSANLGSNVEAVNIQRFFNKSNNLEKLIKILPKYNIATNIVELGELKPDVSREIKGTGLGLSKRILDRFYEPIDSKNRKYVDPTGEFTSESGRSKGLRSQVPVYVLKKEFRGTPSIETINQVKSEIGITPKGELPVLPKGALRSEIGQMLKGLANTYSTLAANKLIRNKLQEQGASLQRVADIAAGKRDVMLSSKKRDKKLEEKLGTTRKIQDVIKALELAGINIGDINTPKEIDISQEEIEDVIVKGNITEAEFLAVKMTNFGVKTVYGEFDKEGNFREFSKKEKKAKGKNQIKFKYYELKNGEFSKVPIRRNATGNLVEDKQKADKIKESRSGEFLPDRTDIYYGTDDPAFKRALALAIKNSTKDSKKPRRVQVRKAGTKEANEQFKVNIEVLEDMVGKLADAVNKGNVSKAAAIKFITKAYQATSGIIKISAPFKYYSENPKYGGPLGKGEQNSGALFREEHTVPASTVGGYLIYGILSNNPKSVMDAVKKQFFQIKLGKDIDVVLDKSGYAAKGAEGFSIFDDNFAAARMLAANIKTEGIELMPRVNMNDLISYETGKSWAEELGVVLPENLQTVENLDLQNRLLMDMIKPGEKQYSNHQEYLNKSVKLDKSGAALKNQNELPIMLSKRKKPNGKRILNELSNRDKALRNARNPKAPVKGISVFDFDDTLATSDSKVIVNMPASEVQKITGTGDATKIIRTVYDGAVSLISKKKEIKKLNFAADFSEPSRVKLYNTLAKKLEKELGWDLDVFEEFTFGKKTQEDFELTRPEGAKDVKPRDSDLEFTENEVGDFEASFNIDDKRYNVYVDFRGEGDYDLSFKLVEESETFEITPEEFAKRGEELLEQGAEFDFTQFSEVVDGKPGPLIAKLDKAIKKFGNKDVFVLTARPANSASAIYEFLKGLGYEIPLENITGLANSSPEAKAQWMVDKAAEGYNDFYFTDDAYKNVKAVQDAMKVLDVKSKERIVYKDRYDKLDKEMNDILEAKTGIAAEKEYSKAKAEVVGAGKGRFKFFIPPSADDFVGLLYSTLAKGKLGDNQMAWYKKNLIDPYARAMNNISSERVTLAADYKALKKQLGIVPKNLRKKIKGEGFTQEQAVRMYIWNKQDMNIPGLSKTDLADMVKFVEDNASLQVFADQLIEINKGDGYPAPKEYWLSGSITTDLMDGLGGTKRAKHLEEWQQNVDVIFSEKNLNKMEAAYGRPYREAMENMLERMKSGKNRNYNGDSTTGRMLDWLNGSIGAIMFLNTRSAVLQTLSAVNFINFKDNNILAAGKAFANQPQYWKDFKELFNSDFLKERREGMNINVNEADIADMAKRGGAKGAISYLLQLGFTPTQIADSFAIASGGATFYRNRIKTYIKAGMPEAQAKEKAFLDFRETAEESQQSSRPDRISKQQAGPLGRVVLAFANTPSQYARIIKKAGQDLAAGRGNAPTNISKIIYYGAVQGFIFNAIQQALFAADMEDEEEMEEKYVRLANGMADGVLRGMGVSGAATAVVKNAGLRVYNESQKDRPKYEKVAFELTKLSPPIASKLSRINQAAREVQWNSDEMKQKRFSLDNPAWLAAGNVISATTNIPVDRAIKKVNNVKDAFDQDLAMYERIALLSGWQSWELGIDEKKKEKIKSGKTKYEDITYEDIKYEDIKYKD